MNIIAKNSPSHKHWPHVAWE